MHVHTSSYRVDVLRKWQRQQQTHPNQQSSHYSFMRGGLCNPFNQVARGDLGGGRITEERGWPFSSFGPSPLLQSPIGLRPLHSSRVFFFKKIVFRAAIRAAAAATITHQRTERRERERTSESDSASTHSSHEKKREQEQDNRGRAEQRHAHNGIQKGGDWINSSKNKRGGWECGRGCVTTTTTATTKQGTGAPSWGVCVSVLCVCVCLLPLPPLFLPWSKVPMY